MSVSAEDQANYAANLQADAPNRCERCDHPLPTWEDRMAHMNQTTHCQCPWETCKRYIRPGSVYGHFCIFHAEESWNDHQIASGDRSTLRESLPWVREEFQRNHPETDVDVWLGYKESPPVDPVASAAFRKKLEDGMAAELAKVERERAEKAAESGKAQADGPEEQVKGIDQEASQEPKGEEL